MSPILLSLKNKLELCFCNSELSDCEFVVGKQKCKIKGHKLLFGISSPVFRAMLYDDTSKNVVTFKIKDVEAAVFYGMKQFLYTDNVNFISSLYACSVYLASKNYKIPELSEKCIQYIKDNISVTEVIDVYEFSRLNSIPVIEKICSALFQDKTREIMQSERFLSADILTLETILKLDSLKLNSELEVFKYTEKWILAEASRRNIDFQQLGMEAEHFNCIMRHIRFLTMDKDQYQEGLSKSDLLTAEEKLSIAHNLLGFEDQLPQKLSAVTENRIFTKEEEEEDDDEKEDNDNNIDEQVRPTGQQSTALNKQNIGTQANFRRIYTYEILAEEYVFDFYDYPKSHHFKYWALDLVLDMDITRDDNEITAFTFTLKEKNNGRLMLNSKEKIIIFTKGKNYVSTIYENTSIIDAFEEHTFPYRYCILPRSFPRFLSIRFVLRLFVEETYD